LPLPSTPPHVTKGDTMWRAPASRLAETHPLSPITPPCELNPSPLSSWNFAFAVVSSGPPTQPPRFRYTSHQDASPGPHTSPGRSRPPGLVSRPDPAIIARPGRGRANRSVRPGVLTSEESTGD